jgi:hypothetical protein
MDTPWRNHPSLKGRFHPEAPDDIQVIVHNGGPRTTTVTPELIWVSVSGIDDQEVFRGKVLNEPHQVAGLAQGSEIAFLATNGEHALMV